ncbi:MAG: type II toxin-antitoxin system PemK/MazF family toxin [Verrucomicrobia bacterium]|nr:type II toxin-antitoxin system PemK/MazF family toxin [Verrucomicrobiota bacterium]
MNRFDVWLTDLDPTRGAEMQKRRPCVIVSPRVLNRMLATVLVAPMTAARHGYPSRVACEFAGREGEIAVDQMRCVDKGRLVRRVGRIDALTAQAIFAVLAEMFSE